MCVGLQQFFYKLISHLNSYNYQLELLFLNFKSINSNLSRKWFVQINIDIEAIVRRNSRKFKKLTNFYKNLIAMQA